MIEAERAGSLRLFDIPSGFNLMEMREELHGYVDVLLGRTEPPISIGTGTLMEVAEAYHARASEMEMAIHQAEVDGHVLKNSAPYKFRTGQLRTFIELCKRTIDLGSRRITVAQIESEARG